MAGGFSSRGLAVASIVLSLGVAAWLLRFPGHGLLWRIGEEEDDNINEEKMEMEEVERRFLEAGSNVTIACHLYRLTLEPHVAGTPENLRTADYVLDAFAKSGLKVHYRDYEVLLSYPLQRSLVLMPSPGASSVVHLGLQEDAVDNYSSDPRIVPTFHGYAPSGCAVADVVYVNYGRIEDYALLKGLGLDVNGSIVLARYGNIYRGDIVNNAEKRGAVGVIIYSDPMDYAANGTQEYYPHSKWLPPSGVQRGTVFLELGDPLTPGWPSTPDSERLSVNDSNIKIPRIPSLPISAKDALPIMKALSGPVAPPSWHGGLELDTYHVGRGPAQLNLSYFANQTIRSIRNVFATIEGYEDRDRYVLLGNHRDAWTFGASDPNSGTAALLEIAGRLGDLLKTGWKPRRTMLLCSWDAEEFGLVGSTEWVEENLHLLSSRAIAYLNVDIAVSGEGFFASLTPQLDELLKSITRKVKDPDHQDASIYDIWVESLKTNASLIGRLGGTGSDYAAFLQHVGISSADLSFGSDYPVYHSSYDNYMWMKFFGDPGFQRHIAMANVWGILALRLAYEVLIPFDYELYATELKSYTEALNKQLIAAKAPPEVMSAPIYRALEVLKNGVEHIKHEMQVYGNSGTQLKGESRSEQQIRRSINDRLMLAERAFLDSSGLPDRDWYKHLVYGPVKDNEYGSSYFPAIIDTIRIASAVSNDKGWSSVQHEIFRVARVLTNAGLVLQGELT